MRKDWEVKKLGDVCEIERGGSPRPISEYITNDINGINWIKIGDASDNSKYISSTKEKIKPEGVKKSRMVYKGDFILSNSMSFGKPYILDIDGCIHDGWLVIRDINNLFDKSFLYYYLSSPQTYQEFKRMAVGGVVNNLNSNLVRSVCVPVPPLHTQNQIVEELDSLTSIIEKQKKQLEELDNLAQAIFYDMFGDPIENEKEWKLFFIDDVCVKKNFIERANHKYHVESIIYYIDISSVNNKNYTISKLSEIIYKDAPSRAQQCVKKNDILVSLVRPNLKNIALVELTNNNLVASSGFCVLRVINNIINEQFLKFCLTDNSFTNYLVDNVKGANYPAVNESDIRKYKVPVPPIFLQQDFASKIEAIEKQKELIKKSIKETEDLFNSRMDYYFN